VFHSQLKTIRYLFHKPFPVPTVVSSFPGPLYLVERGRLSLILRQLFSVGYYVQGGPAKVKPTYIFASDIILVTFECIGKIQWFLANVITVYTHTLGSIKI